MKRFTACFLIISCLSMAHPAVCQQQDLIDEIRKELFYSEFDLEKGMAFYKKIVDAGTSDATLLAYQAAAKALIAKYSWNPISKFSSLKNAEQLLTDAISRDKENLEVRFLRFYIENSIPHYLGYSKNLDEDCAILLNNLDKLSTLKLDQAINDYILSYLDQAKARSSKMVKAVSLH